LYTAGELLNKHYNLTQGKPSTRSVVIIDANG